MVVGSFRSGLLQPGGGAGPIVEQDIDSAFAELGLRPGASEADVKAAWRRLVSVWHPDRNPSAAAPARMQRINRAVEAIRRAGYRAPPRRSTHGREAAAAAGARAAGHAAPAAGTADDAGPVRTVKRKVILSLEEAAFGCTRVLRGKATAACATCQGQPAPEQPCPRCQGSGRVRPSAWFGWTAAAAACDACQGRGRIRPACAACAGSGKAPGRPYAVTVRFPPGVRQGDLLGVPARPGQLPCALNIHVEVRPHPVLTLDPDGTLRCELPVDGFSWVANRPVDLPTLDGLQRLPLQCGQLSYRLPGQGFPVERRGARGDQVVTVVPVFPASFSTDQQILLDQLIATTAGGPDERLRRWQQGLQDWQRGARPRR